MSETTTSVAVCESQHSDHKEVINRCACDLHNKRFGGILGLFVQVPAGQKTLQQAGIMQGVAAPTFLKYGYPTERVAALLTV